MATKDVHSACGMMGSCEHVQEDVGKGFHGEVWSLRYDHSVVGDRFVLIISYLRLIQEIKCRQKMLYIHDNNAYANI